MQFESILNTDNFYAFKSSILYIVAYDVVNAFRLILRENHPTDFAIIVNTREMDEIIDIYLFRTILE